MTETTFSFIPPAARSAEPRKTGITESSRPLSQRLRATPSR